MSRATIEGFYAAFARLDSDTMTACYAEEARFDDEAFSLAGRGARSAACGPCSVPGCGPRACRTGSCRPAASPTQGLIARHRDRFDFWRWSRQALGLPGWLLGWTPFRRRKVRAQAAANLKRFLERG